MGYILVQRSHDVQFNQILSALDAEYHTLIVADSELNGVIEQHQHNTDGFVVFHLTEATSRAAELLTNERFNAPTTPIAYLGKIGPDTRLPYSVAHFEILLADKLVEYLRQPRQISVLVVEDDDAIRDVLQLSLSKHFVVSCAADGPIAMQLLENKTFDIVVLDLMLPGGISGEEIFTHSHTSQPDTPVVIITAHDTKKLELDFAFRGADAYVPKPFDSNSVFRHLLMKTIKDRHEKTAAHARLSRLNEAEHARRAYAQRMRPYT